MNETITNEVWATKIVNSSPSELIVTSYELINYNLNLSVDFFHKDDFEGFEKSLMKAQDFLYILVDGLDFTYPIASDLMQLYMVVNKNIGTAKVTRKIRYVDEIFDIITPLKEAFTTISQTDTAGIVMKNTATLYAGLTYGKNCLNENIVEQKNRGYTV